MLLNAPHECGAQPGHLIRILAEGSDVDDGVVGIVVHVQHRREGDVDPHGPGLQGGDPAHLVGKPRIVRRSQRHEVGELCGSPQDDVGRGVDGPAEAEPRSRLQARSWAALPFGA